MRFMGQGQPFDQPQSPIDARQTAAPILDAPGDHLAGPRLPASRCDGPSMTGSRSAPRVSILWIIRCLSCGRCSSRSRSVPLSSMIGHFVPVTDRMQTLRRQVVGVVAAFAHLLRPADQCRVQAILHLLRLLVQLLLRHLLPGETQITRHGHKAQANHTARREQQAALRRRHPVLRIQATLAIGSWVR